MIFPILPLQLQLQLLQVHWLAVKDTSCPNTLVAFSILIVFIETSHYSLLYPHRERLNYTIPPLYYQGLHEH